MSTQQDIYAASSENRLSMLYKDKYVPWSSQLLRYAKSKPNGKLLVNSILHGPYVRQMIVEPGDPNRDVLVAESFHEQTDDELTEKEEKQMIKQFKLFLWVFQKTSTLQQITGNQNGYNAVQIVGNQNENGNVVAARAEDNVRPMRRDVACLQTQLLIAQKEEVGIHDVSLCSVPGQDVASLVSRVSITKSESVNI
ncbi:hypothetical protein Tco_1353047 [Tanacetum coccineum]